jgi:hypothetical protein
MVRPERRVVLAGESPVRVSAGAPGSRLEPGGGIRLSRAECRKLFKKEGEQTGGPQQSVIMKWYAEVFARFSLGATGLESVAKPLMLGTQSRSSGINT